MNLSASVLAPVPISNENFAAYGWLLDASLEQLVKARAINAGTSLRQEGQGDLTLSEHGGKPCLAIFRAEAWDFSQPCKVLERHVFGSQTFAPLGDSPYVVLVANSSNDGRAAPDLSTLAAFLVSPRQVVTLAPGTWHHGLIAVKAGDFLVIERSAALVDCEEHQLTPPVWLSQMT